MKLATGNFQQRATDGVPLMLVCVKNKLVSQLVLICGPLVKWPKTPASHAGNSGSNPLRVTIFKKLYVC